MLQVGWSRFPFPSSLDFPSNRTVILGSTKPLTEMSSRNFRMDNGRPVRKADNLVAVFEEIV
jgi:hypothetical protein